MLGMPHRKCADPHRRGREFVEAMVAGIDRGFQITCPWYLRETDLRTIVYAGLTRDSAQPIENRRNRTDGALVMPSRKMQDCTFTSLSEAVSKRGRG
jgi:hypothetical protein